jgi:hypothetical protein
MGIDRNRRCAFAAAHWTPTEKVEKYLPMTINFATTTQALLIGILATALAPSARAEMDVAGTLIEFNDNGAWSWFEDDRAIVDLAAGKIVVSSVANSAGTGGAPRDGDVDVASLDLASGVVTRFTLAENLEADDHNSAALWKRPDGRYLAMYSKHSTDQLTRWRISTNPSDVLSWGAESTLSNGAGTTYSNVHYLPNDNGGAGRLYDFTRTTNFNPNFLVSSDLGNSWSYGGRLLTIGTGSARPYVRYDSDGQRIHLITTEQHPRNFDNSIYHGYVQDAQLFGSTGSVLDANLLDTSAVAPNALTPVFLTGTPVGGVPMTHAWTIDVATDDAGLPYAAFQTRANGDNSDHRFFYARFNGSTWTVNQVAKAGGFLYSSEGDYTGLVALDPHDPNRLFISSKIDPRNDATMPHYEIFQGITANGGTSWNWSPITFNSTVDNIRPIVPKWDDEHTALLWMRGNYATFRSYNLDVVGLTQITPIQLTEDGDLNRDGDVNLQDFQLFLGGLHANLGGLSFDDAYAEGDLNGDLANNHKDFLLFKNAYDAANGFGAFAAALQAPEPAGLAVVALGAVGAVLVGRSTRAGSRARRRTTGGLAALFAVALFAAPAQAFTFLQVDMNDRTVVDMPNTVAGFNSFTLTGTTAASPSPVTQTINGHAVTLAPWDDGTDGNPVGQIDDRDRTLPTDGGTLTYAQIYDDFIFAGASVGASGGMDLMVTGGALQPNFQYNVSIYSYDGQAINDAATRRTATWYDRNNLDSPVLTTDWIDDVPPTTNDMYKFTGIARTDSMGTLFLRGRGNPADSSATPPINNGPPVYINGFELDTLGPVSELTLDINTTTGRMRIVNELPMTFDANYYEIRSAGGSLNVSDWYSLDDQDPSESVGMPGLGWEEGSNNSANVLSEARLQGESTFATGSIMRLGAAFTPGGAQDVQFLYAAEDMSLRLGSVRYSSSADIPGDFDGNRAVNGQDLAVWRNDFGINDLSDGDNDGDSDGHDFLIWQQNLGIVQVAAAAAVVPEPSGLAMFILTGAIAWAGQARSGIRGS